MKGFQFRLEPVLNLRRHREETLQIQLAESQRTLDREIRRLRDLEAEMSDHTQRLARAQALGPLDIDRLQRESLYLALLERRLEEQRSTVEKQSRRVDEDREAVLQASRERKALEKLREALLLSFAREEARKEQKTAEDLATARHVRRQQGLQD